jgi:ParB/RepB/Spo0J family partition protein
MTARKTPAAPAEEPAADSAGITSSADRYATAPVLQLARLAPHPANPREDLGDLTELQASVAEIGILEPLVVASVAAHLAGGWPAVADDATHVILAGHRRRAAASAAGLEEAPCVVRDDLAGDDALVVMAAENDPAKRHGLTPLAEARVFEQLAGRGWSQRQTAARMGCGQAHVSKRLTLLKLPEPAIDALATGKITPADGAELARLASHPDQAVQALRDLGRNSWDTAGAVVTRHLHQIERTNRAAATKAQLEDEGIKVVDPGQLGPYGYSMRLGDGEDPAPHRDAGCLVGAAASHNGERELYCRDPASHEGTAAAVAAWAGSYAACSTGKDAARAEEERQRAAAARAQKAAAAQLAARPVSAARAAELVSLALIARHVDAQCLQTAAGWLREAGLGPADGDHYAYAASVTASGDLVAIRSLAHAMALAADERAAGSAGDYSTPWDGRQVAYLERLADEAGYQPGEWEQARLDEARGRIRARAELSCPDCGCRYNRRCKEGYGRCDVEAADDGTWGYRCRCAPAGDDRPAGEEEARDDLFDAVEALAFVLDRAGTVAEEMSDALAAAVEEPADALAEAFAQQAGDGDTSELLQAVRAVHAAALPCEPDWPDRLQAAFAELAACGVIAGEQHAA